MAGIEKLEVHSKSYIVRWVRVDQDNTLSWSVQPNKKSINFGIVKHPGSGAATLLSATGDVLDSAPVQGTTDGKGSRFAKKETTAQDLLISKGFIPILWHGKCEADKVSRGTHDVHVGDGGMYGLVFDNTFSKQTSKTATFVVLTYPTGAPPQTTNNLPNLQLPNAETSQSSLGKYGTPQNENGPSASVDSLPSQGRKRAQSSAAKSDATIAPLNYHVGTLSKRRRKKRQGYARRFFSLDYSTCTLSYYYNRNSSALRGAIPLSLAAIAADERRREISIDSGAEVWHLRAPNDKEFQDWAQALERASRLARGLDTLAKPSRPALKLDDHHLDKTQDLCHSETVEWQQVETLVSRVVGTRDALRRLTKEVSHLPRPSPSGQFLSPGLGTPSEESRDSYFPATVEKKPFWKRKSSAPGLSSSPTPQTTASGLALPSPGSATSGAGTVARQVSRRRSRGGAQEEKSLHDHCGALLSDLDSVVSEFTALIANSKRRRLPLTPSAEGASRMSIETTSTDEFFDAEDAKSGVVKIDGSEDESAETEAEEESIHESSSISSIEDEEGVGIEGAGDVYPVRPKNLSPLPLDKAVTRRSGIPPALVQPPSLIAFVRKNVGKDLSTISMPVSANEPISLLQKVAESLEYAQLLDKACRQKSPTERLLFVTAFAVSQFSGGRAKERAIRKPFNPLLGETFELVRTNKETPGGFRLLVEKVQHRPVRLAMQADSANWSFSHSPAPGQKFWGKSAEITTDGRVRVVLRLTDGNDELYSWNVATMFLRNVVMGEKYVEPVGSMHVSNDTTGHKANVEFKSKGMFGGRAEDVHVTTFSPDGGDTGSGLAGTWTGGLKSVGPGKAASEEIWEVGEMADNPSRTYGMTLFAVSLNEITEIEKGKIAPTDTRLRPDQRLAEKGDLDGAEKWKHNLEEAQRARRREMEDKGHVYRPRWFVRAEDSPDGEEVWKIKTGKEGYWEERAKGTWSGVQELFDVPEL
ncbi:Oxysterol-binding protein [Metarhizium album ARSEF 1941]|uniref:Oxysterol-binding protein n=1 Tax=Metarhizium album (strain ARSEF 1941) TaxID=1081103 RepID=A0A0B2WT15_METAS|nr:Oxysterol-binding protein [Metarhizium album ARSEF 1941]KHN96637.1 Oxysterol-binding protein [Metarhizium album ARSEF 1941]